MKKINLTKTPTFELCAELEKRAGVEVFEIKPFAPYKILTENKTKENTGPVSIFVVWD